MSNKRPLHLTSPDYTDKSKSFKLNSYKNMSSPNQDVFSWEKLCNLLDCKLKDVARKSDLIDLKNEVEELRKENLQLKNDVQKLTSRLEFIDRRSRSSNIIVSGLQCVNNNNGAKLEFTKLCSEVLKLNLNVVSVRKLPSSNTYCFTMESNMQAFNVIASKKKLKGKCIFIQKDYTEDEQSVRYNLRQVSKSISKFKPTEKVRLGEFCIFVNNIRYTWSKGKIIANNSNDAEILMNLLAQCNYEVEICVKGIAQNNSTNSRNTNSQ